MKQYEEVEIELKPIVLIGFFVFFGLPLMMVVISFFSSKIFPRIFDSSLSIHPLFLFPLLYIIHEAIHWICFRFYGVPCQKIELNFSLKSGSININPLIPISVKNMQISLISPFIITLIIYFLVQVLYNNFGFGIIAAIMVSGCCYDVMFYMILNKVKNKHYLRTSESTLSEEDERSLNIPKGFGIFRAFKPETAS